MIMAAFVTVLLCSNLIGVSKITTIAGFTFGAGALFFPFSYIFNDVLTEVYGFTRSRKVVWVGFGAMLFASIMSFVVVTLPPSLGYENQAALEAMFGTTWRIFVGSLTAFFLGEYVNSVVLAKMKVATAGRMLWARTIGSTIAGELVDSLIFYPIAFFGTWSTDLLIKVMFTNYILKVVCEVVLTPVTYALVGFLKRAEHEDYYDRTTDFSPFKIETDH